MTRLVSGLALTTALLILAACNGRTDKTETKSAAAPAPAPAAGQLRAGLWEYALTFAGAPAQTVRTCADPSHIVGLPGGSKCSESRRTLQADGTWSIQATCDVGHGGTSKTTGTMRGDPNSAYTLDLQMTISGATPAELNGSQAVSVNAKWVSETCPAELKPGVIDTPQGTIDSSGMKSAK